MSSPPDLLANILHARAQAGGVWRERQFERGDTIFEQGDDRVPVCVLQSGLVKLAYPTAGGDVWTKSFVDTPGVFGRSPGESGTVGFSATALEDCTVGCIDAEWVEGRLGDAALREAYATFQAWLLDRKRLREAELLCCTPADRYRRFIAREGELAARLEQREIAAWLGITPEALSRIRRRLRA